MSCHRLHLGAFVAFSTSNIFTQVTALTSISYVRVIFTAQFRVSFTSLCRHNSEHVLYLEESTSRPSITQNVTSCFSPLFGNAYIAAESWYDVIIGIPLLLDVTELLIV